MFSATRPDQRSGAAAITWVGEIQQESENRFSRAVRVGSAQISSGLRRISVACSVRVQSNFLWPPGRLHRPGGFLLAYGDFRSPPGDLQIHDRAAALGCLAAHRRLARPAAMRCVMGALQPLIQGIAEIKDTTPLDKGWPRPSARVHSQGLHLKSEV
jgi:hypothetical protein